MEKKYFVIIALTVLVFVLEAVVLMQVFREGGIGDSLFTGLNRMSMKLDDPEEYRGEFDGYASHTYSFDEGSQITEQVAVYVYQTADGSERSVESRLTDKKRGKKLPQSVTVLDDGRNAYIQNDLEDMKAIAMRGLSKLGMIAAIPVIAVIIGVIFFKIRRKTQTA